MLPRRATFQSLPVLAWVQKSAKEDRRLRPGTNSPLKRVFLVADPGARSRHGVTVLLGGVPLRFEGLVQGDYLKSRPGQGVIDRLIDFWVGTAQVKPADLNLSSQRF